MQPTAPHRLSSVDRTTKTAICSVCGAVKIRVRTGKRSPECMTKRLADKREGGRQATLRRRYKMTEEEFSALAEAQNGRCAICRTESPGSLGVWSIDHDHSCCPGKITCGKCVRGLLCTGCNTALGRLQDNIEILRAAVAYLEGPPAAEIMAR